MDYKVFSGLCADEGCKTKLYFPVHKTVIECPNCGQRHSQEKLGNVTEVTNAEEAITQVLKSMVWDAKMPKKGSDTVKVNGLSNYHCKLLSPLFTKYGMDKEGNPKVLSELGHGETADSGRLLSNRGFLIAPEHIDITGYGRDQSGSVQYLEGLLDIIKQYHGGEERLIPIHADGDGHCLVHALSRATTGREIFWHALRENLVSHLEKNLTTYKNLFKDFIDQDDWKVIIDEADPYHVSPEGFNVGLGNIHIFALANVLKRPIVLLDSLKGMKNVADYTAIFVPALVEPSQCRDNLPLCIAWSGSSHNHFIPLVGVAGRPLPTIPQSLIPNIWGIDRTQGLRYLKFNDDGSLTVAGGKPLKRGYLLRLVSTIEKVFLQHHSVAAKLVADMLLYVYQRVGFVGLHPDVATEKTRMAVSSGRIFRCLMCNALSLASFDEKSLKPGGYLYKVMVDSHGSPRTGVLYNFPLEGVECKYDAEKGCLVPYNMVCSWCGAKMLRKVDRFGATAYENGDCTSRPADRPNQCCGYKHYWNGKEYENVPRQFMLNVTIDGIEIEEEVTWFYGDTNPELNSSSKEIATKITEKIFGSDHETFEEHKNLILMALRSYVDQLDLGAEDNDSPFRSEPMEFDHEPPQVMAKQSKHKRKFVVPTVDVANKVVEDRTLQADKSGPPSALKSVPASVGKTNPAQASPTKSLLEDAVKSELKKKESSTPTSRDRTVKIRVSTSDGRQETLNVDYDLDFIGLQNTVRKYFAISPSRQVLKHGFPPKAIEPTHGKMSLNLRNGDRIMVEIKPEITPERKMPANSLVQDGSLLKKGFHIPGVEDTAGALQGFADLLQSAKPKGPESTDVDVALTAVATMAEVTGKSVWEYAVHHPELFRSGGAFYNQFCRDIGLTHGRHCMLPMLPGRVFRYNGDTDEVELCLEPSGHFPINPDVLKMFATKGQDPRQSWDQNKTEQRSESENEKSDEVCKDGEVGAEKPAEEDESEPMEVDNDDDETGTQRTDVLSNRDAQNQDDKSKEMEKKESKIAPGFTTLGPEPTVISQEEAESKRLQLLNVLRSKKHGDT